MSKIREGGREGERERERERIKAISYHYIFFVFPFISFESFLHTLEVGGVEGGRGREIKLPPSVMRA